MVLHPWTSVRRRGKSGCGVTQPQRSEDGRSRSRSLTAGGREGGRSPGKGLRGEGEVGEKEEKGRKTFRFRKKSLLLSSPTTGRADKSLRHTRLWLVPEWSFDQFLPEQIQGAPFFLLSPLEDYFIVQKLFERFYNQAQSSPETLRRRQSVHFMRIGVSGLTSQDHWISKDKVNE